MNQSGHASGRFGELMLAQAAIGLSLGVIVPALAQESDSDATSIEEIVVTTRFREERAQDIGQNIEKGGRAGKLKAGSRFHPSA